MGWYPKTAKPTRSRRRSSSCGLISAASAFTEQLTKLFSRVRFKLSGSQMRMPYNSFTHRITFTACIVRVGPLSNQYKDAVLQQASSASLGSQPGSWTAPHCRALQRLKMTRNPQVYGAVHCADENSCWRKHCDSGGSHIMRSYEVEARGLCSCHLGE